MGNVVQGLDHNGPARDVVCDKDHEHKGTETDRVLQDLITISTCKGLRGVCHI